MNELVEKLGDAMKQLAMAVKYSTRNNNIGQQWTNDGINSTIDYLNQAKAINDAQERCEIEPEHNELLVK